ncbi:MAG: hypothetical protein ACBR20_24550 [Microcoleus sp.]
MVGFSFPKTVGFKGRLIDRPFSYLLRAIVLQKPLKQAIAPPIAFSKFH